MKVKNTTTENSGQDVSSVSMFNVQAPAGRLGIILENKINGEKGTYLTQVSPDSPLADKLIPGDEIVEVNEKYVHQMDITDILNIFQSYSEKEKNLRIMRKTSASMTNKRNTDKGERDVAHNKVEYLPSPSSESRKFPAPVLHEFDGSLDKKITKKQKKKEKKSTYREVNDKHAEVNNEDKFNSINFLPQESAPPLPPAMVFDDSIPKSLMRPSHRHNNRKKNTRKVGARGKECKEQSVEYYPGSSSGDRVAMTPISCEFDDSLDKKLTEKSMKKTRNYSSKASDSKNAKINNGENFNLINVLPQESAPPLPPEMVFDDSIAKKSLGKSDNGYKKTQVHNGINICVAGDSLSGVSGQDYFPSSMEQSPTDNRSYASSSTPFSPEITSQDQEIFIENQQVDNVEDTEGGLGSTRMASNSDIEEGCPGMNQIEAPKEDIVVDAELVTTPVEASVPTQCPTNISNEQQENSVGGHHSSNARYPVIEGFDFSNIIANVDVEGGRIEADPVEEPQDEVAADGQFVPGPAEAEITHTSYEVFDSPELEIHGTHHKFRRPGWMKNRFLLVTFVLILIVVIVSAITGGILASKGSKKEETTGQDSDVTPSTNSSVPTSQYNETSTSSTPDSSIDFVPFHPNTTHTSSTILSIIDDSMSSGSTSTTPMTTSEFTIATNHTDIYIDINTTTIPENHTISSTTTTTPTTTTSTTTTPNATVAIITIPNTTTTTTSTTYTTTTTTTTPTTTTTTTPTTTTTTTTTPTKTTTTPTKTTTTTTTPTTTTTTTPTTTTTTTTPTKTTTTTTTPTTTTTTTPTTTTTTSSTTTTSTTTDDSIFITPTTTTPTPIDDSGNDHCEDAIRITSVPSIRRGNTEFASPDFESNLEDTCGIQTDSRGVWYKLESDRRRIVRLEYELYSEKAGRSELSLFMGSCGLGNLACVDNTKGDGLTTYEFLAEEREIYFFLLSGEFAYTVGDYEFRVSEYDIPSNDNCERADVIESFPSINKGSTIGATPDFDELTVDLCGINLESRGVWHSMVGRGKIVRLEYQLYSKAMGESELSVFQGTCENLSCMGNAVGGHHYVGWWGNIPADNHLAVYEFHAEEGENYMFLLSGQYFKTVADYALKVIEHEKPRNDKCTGAYTIDSFPSINKGTTLGATSDFDESTYDTCGINIDTRGVWYTLVGKGAVVRLEYKLQEDYLGNHELAVFSGSCRNLNCVENIETHGRVTAAYEFLAEKEVTYFFLLSGQFFTTTGSYDFKVFEYEIPDNDNCESARDIALQSLPMSVSDSTAGATPDFNVFNQQCGANSNARGVWFSFIGNGKLTRLSYTNTLGRTRQFSLFKGPCNALTCEKNNGYVEALEFSPSPGAEYKIHLTGTSFSAVSEYDFTMLQYDTPENDKCGNAISITNFPFSHYGDLKGATSDFDTDNILCGRGYWGVWFSFIGTGKDFTIELKTIAKDRYFQSEISLFEGACNELVCIKNGHGVGSTAIASTELTADTFNSYNMTATVGVRYLILAAGHGINYDEIPYMLSVSEVA